MERLRSRGKYLRWMGKAGVSRRADCPLGYRRSSSATNARNWCSTSARSVASSIDRQDEHAHAVKLVRPTTSLELADYSRERAAVV